MVVGAARGDGVAQATSLAPSACAFFRPAGSSLELRGHDLLELGGHARDLVLVRAALEGGEDGLVDLGLEAPRVLAEEDHAGARARGGTCAWWW